MLQRRLVLLAVATQVVLLAAPGAVAVEPRDAQRPPVELQEPARVGARADVEQRAVAVVALAFSGAVAAATVLSRSPGRRG